MAVEVTVVGALACAVSAPYVGATGVLVSCPVVGVMICSCITGVSSGCVTAPTGIAPVCASVALASVIVFGSVAVP